MNEPRKEKEQQSEDATELTEQDISARRLNRKLSMGWMRAIFPGVGKTALTQKLIRDIDEEEDKRREKKRRFYEKRAEWVNSNRR